MPEDLEQRIARLEAVREIERLKIRYAEICDAGYDLTAMAEIFTDDVVWDGGPELGRHEGKQAVLDFFAGAPSRITWALHYMIAASVEIDDGGETAGGSWYLLQPCTIAADEGPRAVLGMSRYADRFRRESGRWLLSEINVDVQTESPLDEGWVKKRFLAG